MCHMYASSTTDNSKSRNQQPRAIIHKKVLEVAESNPDASFSVIAEMVSGASEQLVEQVIEKYGDPAEDTNQSTKIDDQHKTKETETESNNNMTDDGIEPDSSNSSEMDNSLSSSDAESNSGSTGKAMEDNSVDEEKTEGVSQNIPKGETGNKMSVNQLKSIGEPDEEPVSHLSELNNKQRETLRAVHQNPTATQKEIARHLDVSRATISKRVNNIAGFDWKSRQTFVDQLFEDDPQEIRSNDTMDEKAHDELESRITDIEQKVDSQTSADDNTTLGPKLTHKVVHACMDADYFSEEEELQLLRQIL